MRAPSGFEYQRGVALLNVLAVVAIAASVVMAMVAFQQTSIFRSVRVGQAGEADAIARGGEAAAISALRRAAIEAPNSVHYGQAWAHLNETAAPISGGSFTMRLTDDQARFNINALARPNVLALDHLRQIALVLGLPPGIGDAVAARLLLLGPVDRVTDLAGMGLDRGILLKLERLTVALPEDTKVNINTAEEPLLAILFGNRGTAAQLVALRQRLTEITPGDLAAAKILAPTDLGFSSNYFQCDVQVTYGDVTERLLSLLRRKRGGGGVAVEILDRVRIPSSPIVSPELSGPQSVLP